MNIRKKNKIVDVLRRGKESFLDGGFGECLE